jgi:hypothetical protein
LAFFLADEGKYLNNPVGPKKVQAQVKETQTLSEDNIENKIY